MSAPHPNNTCSSWSVSDDVTFDAAHVLFTQRSSLLGMSATLDGVASTCSGFSLGPSLALTAAHCAPLVEADDAFVYADGGRGRVVSARPHPTLDVMLLEISWEGAAPPALARLQDPLNATWSGRRAIVAGYGRTDRYQAGVLHFSQPVIRAIEPNLIRVDTQAPLGACRGDSGGPLLARDDTGQLVAVGVLSTASLNCSGRASFVRIDQLTEWLDDEQAPSPPTPNLRCDDLPDMCDGDRAVRCVDEAIISEPCASSCGWSEEAVGVRCVAQAPCDGVTSEGVCDGEVATRCEAGRVVSVDCRLCEASCGVSPATGRAGCVSAMM